MFEFIHGAFECALFNGAVAGLPVKRKNLRERHSRVSLNLAVQFDERSPGILSEPGSQRRLAASAQSNQRDAHSPRLFFIAEVAPQTKQDFFASTRRKPLQKSADSLFFRRLFKIGSK